MTPITPTQLHMKLKIVHSEDAGTEHIVLPPEYDKLAHTAYEAHKQGIWSSWYRQSPLKWKDMPPYLRQPWYAVVIALGVKP